MALTFDPIHTDLASVLLDLKERTGPDGQAWCRPADAAAIARHITDRTEELGTVFSAVARFVHLAERVSPRAYINFAYQPLLRASLFKAAVHQAVVGGLLRASDFEVDDTAVRLLDRAMLRQAGDELKPFELTYAQMPRLAAFLDVLHNTLGYAVVADLMGSPAAKDGQPRQAADIARELRARFNTWLQPRLESAHRRTQAKTIHAFLASRKAVIPGKIGDEIILEFWQERASDWKQKIQHAQAEPDEGRRDHLVRICREGSLGRRVPAVPICGSVPAALSERARGCDY